MTMAEEFAHELRVRYGECDPQGIVFNANYLLYFDVAFTELWRVAVGPWQDMPARGIDAVVAHAEIDVMRGAELLVAMRARHVCVSTESWEKTDVPPWVREGLERFLVA